MVLTDVCMGAQLALTVFCWAHVDRMEQGIQWTVALGQGISFTAAPLEHRVPAVGYVLKEHDTPPSVNPEAVARAGVSPELVRRPRLMPLETDQESLGLTQHG